jgi:hypothetical protein
MQAVMMGRREREKGTKEKPAVRTRDPVQGADYGDVNEGKLTFGLGL